MKLKVNSKTLNNLLQKANRVINNNSPLPIVSNYYIEIDKDLFQVTTTDLENTIISGIKIDEQKESCKFLIDHKHLSELLPSLTEQEVNIEITDKEFIIVALAGEYKFPIIPELGDFPKVIDIKEEQKEIDIPTSILIKAIDKTSFCVANDELRPVMNGVYFDITEEGISFVSTDAHKLSLFKVSTIKGSNAFILCKKASNLIKPLFGDVDELNIVYDDTNTRIRSNETTFISRQVEGRYPNYNGVIPKDNPNKVIIDRQTLLSACKRISVFSNKASSIITLEFKDNKATIYAQDIDFSISAEEVHECNFTGEIKIGFKSAFLIEILSHITTDTIEIELSTPERAALIFPSEQEEGTNQMYLLMPMLLND